MKVSETGPGFPMARAAAFTTAAVLAAAVLVFLYARHPLFGGGAADVILLGVFFTLVIRFLIGVWAPLITGRGR